MAISFAFPKPKKPFSVVPWSPTPRGPVMGGGGGGMFGNQELGEVQGEEDFLQSRRGQELTMGLARDRRNRAAMNTQPGSPFGYLPGMVSGLGNPAQSAQSNMAYPQAAQAAWEQARRQRLAEEARQNAANAKLGAGLAAAPLGDVMSAPSGDGGEAFRNFTRDSIAARDTIADNGQAAIPVWSGTGRPNAPGWASKSPKYQADARAAWENELEGRRAAVREKAWGREAARQGRLGNVVGATPQELAFQTSPFGQTERGRILSAYGPQGMAAYDAPTIAQYQAEAMGGRNRTARFVQAYRATKAAGGTDEEALKAGLQAETLDEQTSIGNPLIPGTRNPSVISVANANTNIPQSELTPIPGYGRGEFVKTPDDKVYKVEYDPKLGKVLKKPKGNPLAKNSTIPATLSKQLTPEQQAEIERLKKEGEEANRIRNMGFWEQLWRTSRPAEWLGQGLPPKYQWFK